MTQTFRSHDDAVAFLVTRLEQAGVGDDGVRRALAISLVRLFESDSTTEQLGRLIGDRIVIRDREIHLVEQVVPSLIGAGVASAVAGSALGLIGATVTVTLQTLLGLVRRGVVLGKVEGQVLHCLPTLPDKMSVEDLQRALARLTPPEDWHQDRIRAVLTALSAVQFRDGVVVAVVAEQDDQWYRLEIASK